ncbi:unnamed protein product [Cyclocybe aegerita]|uniref:Uncharacterized protein n=1 Tax=Cyclocybe aegerita TaxID=1973307 RepID=A0A8S0WUS7_CYCAE|nr:unnamed protein product [Cyclocybe aegerita]
MTAMASTTPALAPPSYDTLPPRPSSSPPFIPQEPPSYSNQPSPDEETVAYTPRGPAGAPHPQGTFVRKWPQATLILTDQEEGTRLPTYGRGGKIMGELGLASAERVVRVSVKVGSLCFERAGLRTFRSEVIVGGLACRATRARRTDFSSLLSIPIHLFPGRTLTLILTSL